MVGKVGALVVIIIAGFAWMFSGHYENYENPWAGTVQEPGKIAASFYAGIYSYAGWNYLNFVTEELKNPYRDLPRAIYISLPIITAIYVAANIAYFAVLAPFDMYASEAVAVTFGSYILGRWAVVMPIFVAMSAFGSLCVHIQASSRLCFVGARDGMFPDCLSLINLDRKTPVPALVFLGILSLATLTSSDIMSLIVYASWIESLFILVSLSGMLWMRYKRPELKRPIKVNLLIPITFLVICFFLVVLPIYVRPMEVGVGILITASGIPAYLVGIHWKSKPLWLQRFSVRLTNFVMTLAHAAPQDVLDIIEEKEKEIHPDDKSC
ncbi:unnamed protein product [Cyprideis torosa]|uniref:Uncharacterized protein n=1 Tax=Cyprideis torosa TaxID=163714 RepID=A0A7R8WB09_9CRUS|nr:unnamed protein product [Cyprideis torosa]CAG0891611.1 unnamed protein product [Cyprideis torosa]